MRSFTATRLIVTVLASLAVWAVVATACLTVGSSGSIGWPDSLVLAFRWDSVGVASLVGAGLALAGVTYQAILRNPLADPYLLGVSTGSALFSYLWGLPFMTGLVLLTNRIGLPALSQHTFAFAGALLAMFVVFGLANRRGHLEPITLLLVGVIVNAVNASVYLLLVSIQKDAPGGGGPLTFLIGGLQPSLTDAQKFTALAIFLAALLVLTYVAGQLNVAGLSEAEAESLGVRIHRLRWVGLLTASLVTASAVAISGPIGFIGLVCPHLARLVVGHDHRVLIPVATAAGAALLAIADAVSRWLAQESLAQTQLPVGVLTGLLGGPFFLLLLAQSRRRDALPEPEPAPAVT